MVAEKMRKVVEANTFLAFVKNIVDEDGLTEDAREKIKNLTTIFRLDIKDEA